jgi:hypothetical protein
MNNIYGAIGTTVAILLVIYIFVLRNSIKNNRLPIISQSMLHYRYSDANKRYKRMKSRTQSKARYDKNNIKVIIFDNDAYWIKDNIFYKAPLVNEIIDKEAAEEVDTIHMDKVQLDKMLFIMDKLREGIEDDSRSSRDE